MKLSLAAKFLNEQTWRKFSNLATFNRISEIVSTVVPECQDVY
ncbi:MAG: hypothetical protein RM338_01275 [Nostoc sp. DedQUE12a]|nr:hypothetical protein [Nostoc sp. DedQUE12a]